MSTGVKRVQTAPNSPLPSEIARARIALVAIATVLAILVSWLPSPRAAFASPATAGVWAQLDRAAIIAATVVTWILVVWLAAVLLLTVAARVALRGRQGRAVATRLAQLFLPRALRGAVITAVGVGSLAAVTGCAPGAAAVGTVAAATSDGAGAGGTAAPLTIDLDWPFDPPVVPTPVSTPAPFVPPPPSPTPDVANTGTTPASTDAGRPESSASAPMPNADTGPTQSGTAESSSTQSSTPTTPVVAAAPGAASEPDQPAPDASGAAGAVEDVPDTAGPAATSTSGPRPPAPGVVPSAATPSDSAAPDTPDAPATPDGATPTAAAPTAPTASPGPAGHAPATPATTTVPEPPAETARTVTVAAGDSLWSLAAADLPAPASDGDIAEAWPRWYAANRALIGNDPAHIEPGWQLTVPSDREDRTP